MSNNEERSFFMTIIHENPGDGNDPKPVLVVTEHIVVIRESIDAVGANDMRALDKARVDVARRLGVDIETIEY